MTARLLLVRHGETDSNVEGRSQGRREVPLNDHGHQQVLAVASALSGRGIVAAVASPTERARETGEAIAHAAGIELTTDERLTELDQGELDGLTPPEMRERAPDFLRRWAEDDPADLQMPGGESLAQAQARMVEAITVVANAHDGETAVLVSHNLALKSFLCHAFDVPLASFRSFRVDVASVSTVDFHEDGAFSVVQLNERCHL
jgi:broad specificity phosphatase PhoE